MRASIIYAHPNENSFTTNNEAKYYCEVFYQKDISISEDIVYQQTLINESDSIVFIYPLFWNEALEKLVGWVQRVLTYGFGYDKQSTIQ